MQRNGVLTVSMIALLVISNGFFATPSLAFVCFNCATWYHQLLDYVQAVQTQLNTAQQLVTQIKQYNNMVKHGISLPDSMFGSIAADLQSVSNVYRESQALGRQIQNIDLQFNAQFPTFESYLREMANSGQYAASHIMPDRYKMWSEQSRDNLKSAMKAANINTSTFYSEDAQLAKIMARSQSAAGRMQAIQAGNEIAAQNVQQLQKLRDLIATQINMQANYMAQQQDRIRLDDAMREHLRDVPVKHSPAGSKAY